MAPAAKSSGMNLNSFILIAGFTLTVLGMVVGGLAAFYSVKNDVSILGVNQITAAKSLDVYQTNQLAGVAKLNADVTAIQQLIVIRSADRYSKQDAARDQDIIRERLTSLDNRLVTVENRGVERDRSLDQLQRTMNEISNAFKATRPVPLR